MVISKGQAAFAALATATATGVAAYPGPLFQQPKIHYSPACVQRGGWHDVAGAATVAQDPKDPKSLLKHHVFMGCPDSGGWHHGESDDLVHWGVRDPVKHEYATRVSVEKDVRTPFLKLDGSGENATVSSTSPPCSGFVVYDKSRDQWCAGFRQCGSSSGLNKGWDVPIELRCAPKGDKTLATFDSFDEKADPDHKSPLPGQWLYPFYFYRGLPYDPVRPWVDDDGQWYATIAADSCNATKTSDCVTGSAQYLLRLERQGEDKKNVSKPYSIQDYRWENLGMMFASNATAVHHDYSHCENPNNSGIMCGGPRHREFTTPNYIGALPGSVMPGQPDPKWRVLTDNNADSTVFFVGQQKGGPGSAFEVQYNLTGSVDWSGNYINPALYDGSDPTFECQGLTCMVGGATRGGRFTMARTLGSRDDNQVNVPGRRVVVAWLETPSISPWRGAAMMSLPRDLSLTPEGVLEQDFVDELMVLRDHGKSQVVPQGSDNKQVVLNATQRFELALVFSKTEFLAKSSSKKFTFSVLAASSTKERTDITLDLEKDVWFAQNFDANGTLVNTGSTNPVRGGPLYDRTGPPAIKDEVMVHAIVDHSVLSVIVNRRSACYLFAAPSSEALGSVVFPAASVIPSLSATVWPLTAVYPTPEGVTDAELDAEAAEVEGEEKVEDVIIA